MNTQSSKAAIVVNNLKIGYYSSRGEAQFCREGINFSAGKGETVALIGPNGIGKSTLLRTMAGFMKPLDGEILWRGKSVAHFTTVELSKLISFVSTENLQLPNMSVAELVAYGRFPYTNWLGRLNDTDKKAVMESLEKVGMIKFAHRQMQQLSDGERQRVLIARALAQDTPFIILDEPTAFLDISNKYEIFHLLSQLAGQHGKTIVLSTHDLNIALRETDKIWLMLEQESREGAPEDAALNGWLDHLFNNPLIGFDKSKGEFFFTRKPVGKASVDGEGNAAVWTIRALERKGFSLTDEGEAQVRIRILQQENTKKRVWQLRSGGQLKEFRSLHELLLEL